MDNIGKILLLVGAIISILGALVMLLGRFNIPLGHLPGDIFIKGKNGRFYFPVASSILVSVLLSLILNLIARWWGK